MRNSFGGLAADLICVLQRLQVSRAVWVLASEVMK